MLLGRPEFKSRLGTPAEALDRAVKTIRKNRVHGPQKQRIRDVLILIRIRILGPVHLVMDPDPAPDPAVFFSGFQDADTK